MKTKDLIKKLQAIVDVDPDSNFVVEHEDGYTTDVEISCDDENTAVLIVVAGAKQY